MLSRRHWLGACLATPRVARALTRLAPTTQTQPEGFFTLGQHAGRWWLLTPRREPFFSIGLNHIDPAPLSYPENGDLWEREYRNSMERWLKRSVRPDLQRWGFNSVGWAQEVVTRGPTNHRHSRPWTYEEYQWLDLPYCHQLPFADFHQWELETKNPSLFSAEFADWCDYVARTHCARLADDPKLIGYFYLDCPTWVHTRPDNEWKGPMFDPARLKSDAGRAELRKLATQYYRVQHDAIRRYDKHHLILGDRYEANMPLPVEVVEAAAPYVDVLSFQDFKDPVEQLRDWHERTGKPVLWADGAKQITVKAPTYPGGQYSLNNGAWWAETLTGLRGNPGCVGAHLCGAYLRNRTRKRGLRDEAGRPDEKNLALITAANRAQSDWVRSQGR
jgi:hypothetical protein